MALEESTQSKLKLKLPLPRQVNTGPLIGQLLFLYGSGLSLIGILTNLTGFGAYYIIWASKYPVIESIPMWGFYLIMVAVYTIIIVVAYIFIVPSTTAFGNLQSYKHENPIREDLKRVIALLEEIKNSQVKKGE